MSGELNNIILQSGHSTQNNSQDYSQKFQKQQKPEKMSTSPPSRPGTLAFPQTTAASINMLLIQAQHQTASVLDLLRALPASQQISPHLRALQDTLNQLTSRFDANQDQLPQVLSQ